MPRLDHFYQLKDHVILGKIFNKLTAADRQWCVGYIVSTRDLPDDKFVSGVNRIGLSDGPQGMTNPKDVWALLNQCVVPVITRRAR